MKEFRSAAISVLSLKQVKRKKPKRKKRRQLFEKLSALSVLFGRGKTVPAASDKPSEVKLDILIGFGYADRFLFFLFVSGIVFAENLIIVRHDLL